MILAKIEVPDKEPACCRTCQAVSGRKWFIDLGYIEDFWGTVYYCNLCFDELAVAAGYILQEECRKQLRDTDETRERLKYEYRNLAAAANTLREHSFDVFAFADWLANLESTKADSSGTGEMVDRETSVVPRAERSIESLDEQRSYDSSGLTIDF